MARVQGVQESVGDKAREVSKSQTRKGLGCLVKEWDHYPGCGMEAPEKKYRHQICALERSLAVIWRRMY